MESSSLSTSASTLDLDLDFSYMENFDFIFFWNASNDPLNPSEKRMWRCFKEDDQKKLNEDYKKYLNNKKKNICDLGNYKVDFEKFVQINNNDKSKIRPVKKYSSDLKKKIGKHLI